MYNFRENWFPTQYSPRIGLPISNRCFAGPTQVLNANDMSIAAEFFAWLTRWQTDRQTDRPRYSGVHNRRYLPTYFRNWEGRNGRVFI